MQSHALQICILLHDSILTIKLIISIKDSIYPLPPCIYTVDSTDTCVSILLLPLSTHTASYGLHPPHHRRCHLNLLFSYLAPAAERRRSCLRAVTSSGKKSTEDLNCPGSRKNSFHQPHNHHKGLDIYIYKLPNRVVNLSCMKTNIYVLHQVFFREHCWLSVCLLSALNNQ